LVPREPIAVNNVPRSAWWQIDPRSGTTTAVTDEGLHQGTAEAVITREGNVTVVTQHIGGLTRVTRFRNAHNARVFAEGFLWHARDQGFITILRTLAL
jgi:hypothetical protein